MLSDPQERQELPPRDPARILIMIAVILFFAGIFISLVMATFVVLICILILGGAIFIVSWNALEIFSDAFSK